MREARVRNRFLLIAVCAVIIAGAGCDDDCVDCPGTPAPDMDNVWPHADGNAWIYDLEVKGFDGDPSEVVEPGGPLPPLPSMEELHAALDQEIAFPARGQSAGLYRMAFDGDITTDSGVTAQHLTEELFLPDEGGIMKARAGDRLLRRILAVRPDLRAKLPDKDLGDHLDVPLLLGGYAFEATAEGLYSYGDLGTNHSWTYLEGALHEGSEFSIQLLPALGDDLFLYGRIWSVGDQTVGGVTYANCVECFYLADLGVTEVVDENGLPLGLIRLYTYGSVFYAPEVGPVYCHEKSHTTALGFPAGEAVIVEYEAVLGGAIRTDG